MHALARNLVREPRTIRKWNTETIPTPKVVVEWLKNRQG